ncbi:hypothetical protein M9Y10_001315 [Tritrichomonas musculus]|uniref:Non-specific serine/threonine protein kinase n=1 Tax=Tritrichomonas musculus TaxID=1915356 RepID=A0ABR2L6N8_9EUKA
MEGFVIPSPKYTDFFQPKELTGYKQWKNKRKQLVKIMGPKFLSVLEQELISWYSNWEKDAFELAKSNSVSSLLSSLLLISVLHYYQRDIQLIENYFNVIKSNLLNPQRDVAHASAAVLKYFFKEDSDITIFLKQVVAIADNIFQKRNTQIYYNALLILRSVGKFIKEDVFQVTTKIIPELLASIFGPNEVIRHEAIKVFFIHVKTLPDEYASFIEGIVFDCRREISSCDESKVSGSILLIKKIYPIASKYIQPQTFISQIHTNFESFSPELTIHAIDFIIYFVNTVPDCLSKPLAEITLSMAMQKCKQHIEFSELLISLGNFIQVIPKDVVPALDIVTMISMNIEKYRDVGFMVLNQMLKLFPDQQLNDVTFKVVEPDLYYIKVLKRQQCFIPMLKAKLIDTFNTGLKKGIDKNEIISLKILQKFGGSLFEKPQIPFEAVKNLIYSKSEKVRLEMVKTLRCLDLPDSNQALLRMAVFDSSKMIRLNAIHQLDKCHSIAQIEMMTLLLADTSYKVRRTSIPIIWTFARQNPLRPIPMISNFLKQTLISETSPSNSARSAKACSLLPMVAKYLIDDMPSFIPYLIWICVALLCVTSDAPFPNFPDGVGQPFIDLRKVFNEDFVVDDFALSYTPKDPNLYQVFQIENAKYSTIRAKYLFDTFRTLSPHIYSFIYQVVPVFSLTFHSKQPDFVIIAALKALISIVPYCDKPINIIELSPDLLPSLFQLLGDNCSKEVAVFVLMATGTMGVTSISNLENFGSFKEESYDIMKSINDYVFKCLCKGKGKGKSEFTPRILEILAVIITQVDDCSFVPYLGQIISSLIDTIENTNGANLFLPLELIVWKSNFYIQPFLNLIEPLLIKFISNPSCLHLCGQLSYQLKTSFTPIASHIYPMVLNNIQKLDNEPSYSKPAYKLIAYMITFQKQNFDTFLKNVYHRVLKGWKPPKQLLLCILRILKFNSFSFFCQRIMQLCFELISYQELSDLILQIIYYLVLYNNVPIEFIDKQFIKKYATNINHLNHVLSLQPYLRGPISFLKEINLKPNVERLTNFIDKLNNTDNIKKNTDSGNVVISSSNDDNSNVNNNSNSIDSNNIDNNNDNNSNQSPFSNISDPSFNNSSKWLFELTFPIFKLSPIPSIRCCTQLALQSYQIRKELFPIAFLSCWKNASNEEKKGISNTIANIFRSFSSIDPMLLVVAEKLERAGCPLLIPQDLIASVCKSPALSVYFLGNFWLKNPTSKEAIDNFLTVNSTMGRLDCVRGILSKASHSMTQKDSGKWFEQLGEWSTALSIYEKEAKEDKNETSERDAALIRCYGHLEHWETISSTFVPLFDKKFDLSEKHETALWFAWAFYHLRDFEQVKHYAEFFSTKDIKQQIFIILYLISSGQLEMAGPYIEKAFEVLAEGRGAFNGSDTGLATKILVSAQHLIELKEALKIKKKNNDNLSDNIKDSNTSVPRMWKRRLESFRHGSDAWMKLIEIRSLLLSPEEHIDACLKMLSALRKERQWRLIDRYFTRLFSSVKSPKVILSKVKIMYARGQISEAISLMSSFNQYLDGETTENDSKFNGIQPPDDKLRARLLRIQGDLLYQNSGSFGEASLESAKKCFKRSLELNKTDYRSWSGLAYVSSKMINNCGINDAQIKSSLAYDVVISFHKATQIHPESSLEFLCQLLSVFFQYGDNIDIESFVSDLTSLPASAIAQVVPQLVGHIAHSSEKVRNIVRSILECYGISHFESVFYSLNFSCLSSEDQENNNKTHFNKEKEMERLKASIANKIMQKIKLPHLQMHADALLFVDGLRMAAINWFEQWISTLSIALRFISMNDLKSLRKILNEQFRIVSKPRCEFDSLFARTFANKIKDCRSLLEANNIQQLTQLMSTFRRELEDQLRRIDQIQLSKFSVDLAEKRHFNLSVPGVEFEASYLNYYSDLNSMNNSGMSNTNNMSNESVNNMNNNNSYFYSQSNNESGNVSNVSNSHLAPRIYMIDPTFTVLQTQQHPRSVIIIDESGRRWRFLLKGKEDLRLDQRIMQLFKLINTLLSSNRLTSSLGIEIVQYPIVPFAKDCGLIGWVGGADTLQHLVTNLRSTRNIPPFLELNMLHDLVGNSSSSQTHLQRLETFDEIASKFDANELRDIFWLRSPNPETWLDRVDTYTKSTGLMSITGYVIGLGDRHPSNMMVQHASGRVIHIDFGDSFESAMKRNIFPEKVPFRLTRMIVNAFDCAGIDGLFRTTCEEVMNVLRQHKTSIIAQLEIFVHEPVFSTSTAAILAAARAQPSSNSFSSSTGTSSSSSTTITATTAVTNNAENEQTNGSNDSKIGDSMLDRIEKKLAGQDPSPNESCCTIRSGATFYNNRFYRCGNYSSQNIRNGDDGSNLKKSAEQFEWDVPEQVDRLINIAKDPMNYMQHYPGWFPFW